MKEKKTLTHKYLRSGRERATEKEKSIWIRIKICYFICVMLRVPFWLEAFFGFIVNRFKFFGCCADVDLAVYG